ncbi:MAG TPA: hypothetical protein VF432_15330 [Thermoanaerobaculia bacterium]
MAGPNELNANAGMGLGVPYDVVLDCDMNNALSDGDFIDGQTGEAGLYMVHDTTLSGPAAVTELDYNIAGPIASTIDIDFNAAQNLYYPTNIAAMGKRPIVMIGTRRAPVHLVRPQGPLSGVLRLRRRQLRQRHQQFRQRGVHAIATPARSSIRPKGA